MKITSRRSSTIYWD